MADEMHFCPVSWQMKCIFVYRLLLLELINSIIQLFKITRVFKGNGMTMPFWDFRGNAMMTNNYIRLTSNHQGQQGAIWNKVVSYSCW